MSNDRCHDCNALPGELHEAGCDVERCACCEGQRIGCDCKGAKRKQRRPWTGEWPGVVECREMGFWCRDLFADGTPALTMPWPIPDGFRWHVKCEAGDPGAHEDLNRYTRYVGCRSGCTCR